MSAEVESSMHASAVIRALRKKKALFSNPDDDGWGSPGVAPAEPRPADLAMLNDLVRETKENRARAGRTAAGVSYSASELEFYRDHLSGIQGERRRGTITTLVGGKGRRIKFIHR